MRNLFQIEPSEKQRILEQHNFFKNRYSVTNNSLYYEGYWKNRVYVSPLETAVHDQQESSP